MYTYGKCVDSPGNLYILKYGKNEFNLIKCDPYVHFSVSVHFYRHTAENVNNKKDNSLKLSLPVV